MADQKKTPQLFHSDLFSSPSNSGSSGLSLGFDEPFSSPFSLAPASKPDVSKSPASSQSSKVSPGATPPSSGSPRQDRRSKSPSNLTGQQQSNTPASASGSSGTVSLSELSTVPLDSPVNTNTVPSEPPKVSSEKVAFDAFNTNKHGWNEPPALTPYSGTPSRIASVRPTPSAASTLFRDPMLETNADDSFSVQPLAGYLEPGTTNATSAAHLSTTPLTNLVTSSAPSPPSSSSVALSHDKPPPPGPATAASSNVGGGPSNPYRIGTGFGSRKPAYGASGIASFSGSSAPGVGSAPLTSQSLSQQPPMMIPSQPLQPPPLTMAASQGVGPISQGPPIAGPGGSSLLQGGPPPVGSTAAPPLPPAAAGTAQTYTGAIAEPQWSGMTAGGRGSWDQASQPVRYHWFYLRAGEKYWIPFSLVDSHRLEEGFIQHQSSSQEVLIPTDGGRYDVDLHHRQRRAIYWEEPISEVRRCSWFYKGEGERWYLPYDEMQANRLEEEYLGALAQGMWNRRVEMGGGETVIMHSHSAIVHYLTPNTGTLDLDGSFSHPKSVMRGFAEVDKVESGEQSRIDHLVFVVHGIGAHHDLSFRSLVDCVDDFREVAQLMLKTHRFVSQAPQAGDNGGRVEFLPVHWHAALHGDDTGVDCKLKTLTLPSISRLRDFTNSTLLDILYFTSPIYCQTIISQVASEMNRMWEIFQSRNPSFRGGVSVMGHSLGSCALFDLLYHQHSPSTMPPSGSINQPTSSQEIEQAAGDVTAAATSGEGGEDEPDDEGQPSLEEALAQLGLTSLSEKFQSEQIDFDSLLMCTVDDLKELGVPMGPRKKLSTFITEELEKQRVTKERKAREREAREKEQQRLQQQQEAVDSALQKATLQGVKFVRGLAGTGQPFIEYPQLNFQPQFLFALGSPIGLFLTVRGVEELGPSFSLPTCAHVFNIYHPFDPVAYRVEPLVSSQAPERAVLMPHHKGRKRFHLELYENLGQVGASIKHHLVEGMRNMWQQLNEFARSHSSSYVAEKDQHDTAELEVPLTPDPVTSKEEDIPIGQLNQGRRIDYVLQEKPIEKLNEYLFALSSHLCYWRSEDTALFILKEVYQEPNAELIKS